MATQTKENYLKALYHLHKNNPKISITDLGNELEVSKPTANDMVKKLQTAGWVKYTKYKPLELTEKGRKAAALIIRKHRLSEMFLSEIMGFGWEEVHDVAEQIEHIKSDAFFERMDELLGYPSKDPHGSPIPDKEGNVATSDYVRLASLQPGERGEVKALRSTSKDFLEYLNKYKIALGTAMDVLEVEAFDKSMVVAYPNHEKVVLSASVCNRLLVEKK
jgi:DtxR family Mn-dependent transcriptional regulator